MTLPVASYFFLFTVASYFFYSPLPRIATLPKRKTHPFFFAASVPTHLGEESGVGSVSKLFYLEGKINVQDRVLIKKMSKIIVRFRHTINRVMLGLLTLPLATGERR